MTAYDVRARSQAARNLAPISAGGKGQVVTLHAPGTQYRNPTTRQLTDSPGPQQTGSGIEVAYKLKEIDGSLVIRGDKRFMLSPLTTDGAALTPPKATSWKMEFEDGSVWAIQDVDPVAPAGLAAFYWLQLRKA